MALCVLEGFESYGSLTGSDLVNAINTKWDANSMQSDWPTLVDGVNNGKALQWLDNETNPAIIFPVSVSNKIIIGCALKHIGSETGNQEFLDFRYGSSSQIIIKLTERGALEVYRSSTLLGITSALSVGTWYFIEIYLSIDNVTGSIIIKANGETILNLTGIDTQAVSASSQINNVALYSIKKFCIDDIYIYDDTDVDPNFIGLVTIENLIPNSDDTSEWTVSEGSDHYATVNSINDSIYISSDTIDQLDIWTYSNLSSIESNIIGVMQATRIATNAVGVRTLKTLCNTNEIAVNTVSYDNFETIISCYEEDPNTSTAWTVNGINTVQCGVKNGS